MAGADLSEIAADYSRFADHEAHGRSPRYEALARTAAASTAVLTFLATLPPSRRQPNLFLAAVRKASGGVPGPAFLEATLQRHDGAVRRIMLTRSTQTNEPGRCAVLMPALAALPPPLALLEVGASAGLCLLPDRYHYDYGGTRVRGIATPGADTPVFPCRVSDGAPLPAGPVEVAWRAGLDLNPLRANDTDDRDWLETLVWPEQTDRLARLRQALSVAAQVRPPVTAGDLLTDLKTLAADAPSDATLVIYHTAVLAYIADPALRNAFVDTVRSMKAVWICNESPRVFPDIARNAASAPPKGAFLMSVDANPVAWTGPHGQFLDWFGGTP